MNQFSKSLTMVVIVSATVLALPIPMSQAQDFGQNEFASDARWPEPSSSEAFPRVDKNLSQANFESEIGVNVSDAFEDSNAPNLLSKVKPFADDLTQSLREGNGASWMADIKSALGGADIGKVISSLAIVLGGYFGFVWLMRKINPKGSLGLPQEVVEVLGQTSFGAGKKLQLVRLGSKLLLLMNSNEGTQTIGEITDPGEVEYLASLCGAGRSTKSVLRHQKASSPQPTNIPSITPTSVAPQVTGDLKQIIQQLRNVADKTATSIFEA